MKAFKGFNKNMTCRGFHFEVGKTYHEDSAVLCKSGFHACEKLKDCFVYYPPDRSVYHHVELGGEIVDSILPLEILKGSRAYYGMMVPSSSIMISNLMKTDKVCATDITIGEEVTEEEIETLNTPVYDCDGWRVLLSERYEIVRDERHAHINPTMSHSRFHTHRSDLYLNNVIWGHNKIELSDHSRMFIDIETALRMNNMVLSSNFIKTDETSTVVLEYEKCNGAFHTKEINMCDKGDYISLFSLLKEEGYDIQGRL